jgi:hypothetical protein
LHGWKEPQRAKGLRRSPGQTGGGNWGWDEEVVGDVEESLTAAEGNRLDHDRVVQQPGVATEGVVAKGQLGVGQQARVVKSLVVGAKAAMQVDLAAALNAG